MGRAESSAWGRGTPCPGVLVQGAPVLAICREPDPGRVLASAQQFMEEEPSRRHPAGTVSSPGPAGAHLRPSPLPWGSRARWIPWDLWCVSSARAGVEAGEQSRARSRSPAVEAPCTPRPQGWRGAQPGGGHTWSRQQLLPLSWGHVFAVPWLNFLGGPKAACPEGLSTGRAELPILVQLREWAGVPGVRWVLLPGRAARWPQMSSASQLGTTASSCHHHQHPR